MSTLDFPATIARESTRFRTVMERVDPDARVPSCPEWSANDLLWHLTETQWFWGTIAAERLSSPRDAEEGKPDRPSTHHDLAALSSTTTDRLLDALDGLGDDEAVWSWTGAGDGAFVRRRQAHEALVHRVDAELVAGETPELDPDLATDGVDEVLQVMFGLVSDWATFRPAGRRVAVVATDTGRGWDVTLGRMVGTSPRSGRDHDRPAIVVADLAAPHAGEGTSIVGTAADLDLWLWSRTGEDDLALGGDDGALDGLRALVHAGIQ